MATKETHGNTPTLQHWYLMRGEGLNKRREGARGYILLAAAGEQEAGRWMNVCILLFGVHSYISLFGVCRCPWGLGNLYYLPSLPASCLKADSTNRVKDFPTLRPLASLPSGFSLAVAVGKHTWETGGQKAVRSASFIHPPKASALRTSLSSPPMD